MSDYSGMIQELSDICKSLERMDEALSPFELADIVCRLNDRGFVIPHVGSKESNLLGEARFILMNVISLLNKRES